MDFNGDIQNILAERKYYIELAKILDFSKRYNDMKAAINKVAILNLPFGPEENQLFVSAFESVLQPLRKSWLSLTKTEAKTKNNRKLELIRELKEKVEFELRQHLYETKTLVETNLLTKCKNPADMKLYFHLLGDINHYIAEISEDGEWQKHLKAAMRWFYKSDGRKVDRKLK